MGGSCSYCRCKGVLTNNLFVMEQSQDLVEVSGKDGFGNIRDATGLQHTAYLGEGIVHQLLPVHDVAT